MTPDELLAACREAWPETEAGRWRDDPLNAGASRTVVGLTSQYVSWEISVGPTSVGVSGEVIGERDKLYVPPTKHGPEGVREVVTALRAWCRAEVARLAAEVDPP